jgi:hypothetical protein
LYIVLSLMAMKTGSRRFHAAFAVFATVYEIGCIWTSFSLQRCTARPAF